MGARELEALLQQTLRDDRIGPVTRAQIDRVVRQRALDADTVTVFCAQAIVLAQASITDARMRDTFAWLLSIATLTQDGAPAKPPTASASRVAFSPGDDCLDIILDEFARARRSADVCVFTITDDRIRSAMLGARRRGVALRVISDDDKATDEGSDIEALRRAGVEVRVDRSEAHMHHKFAVFDGDRVLTGSYNWTRSAARNNQENVLVTAERAVVDRFDAEFQRLWSDFRGT
jgi:mitochondrial cardiolipin hydrolase